MIQVRNIITLNPLIIGTFCLVLIVLMFGISSQNRLEAQSETGEKNVQESNQVIDDQADYTRWNLPKGAKRRLGKGAVTDMVLSPNSTRLAIAGPLGVWLIDVETESEIALLTGFEDKTEYAIPNVKFSPDSNYIASSGYDTKIRIWNGKTGEQLLTIKMPISPARLYKFLSDGTWSTHIVPANQDVRIGDFFSEGETGSIHIIPGGSLKFLKFLNDSKTLMIQNLRGTIWLWDITTNKQIATYSPKLPIPKLEKYKIWLQMEKLPTPDKWNLETDAHVSLENGIDVIFAFAVGDKNGTISIRDGHTDKEISTLNSQETSVTNTDSPPIHSRPVPFQQKRLPPYYDV